MAVSGTSSGPELLIELDRAAAVPLHRQLADGLRAAIRGGRLAPHTRMPSTRVLAADLGVSRRLVVDAYGQLAAEGFLLSRHGSGTRVATVDAASAPEHAKPARRYDVDFLPGSPDLGSFPRAAWLRALRAGLAEIGSDSLGYAEPQVWRRPAARSPTICGGLAACKRMHSTSCCAPERPRRSHSPRVRCRTTTYRSPWRTPASGCTEWCCDTTESNPWQCRSTITASTSKLWPPAVRGQC